MNLTWKQLEALCVYRMSKESGFIRRAGVTCAELIGRRELNKDRVDFVGESNGVPFKFECKTCSSASFELREAKLKRGQYDELKRFNGVAFILLHFNARRLENFVTESATYAFPVYEGHGLWTAYERGEVRSIDQRDCLKHAISVKWSATKGCRKLSPDLVQVVAELSDTR